MKVLHVINELPKAAGTSVFCVEVCDGLSRLGVETAIAVQRRNEEEYRSQAGIPVLTAAAGFNTLDFRPDVVHIHALWSPFLHRASVWARCVSVPIVHSPHGMLTPWALRAKWHKKMLALAAYQYWDLRQARLLHATAESEREDIRRVGLKRPVAVIPLGVHMPPLRTERPRRSERVALFVSRVHPKKGLLNLVAAWARVRPSGWRMTVAGPDQDGHTAEVKALAERLGVLKDFQFVGPVYGCDKEALYANADLFVLPTFSENFGAVVVEALAHGCPVITTKGTPWSELCGTTRSLRGDSEAAVRNLGQDVCGSPLGGCAEVTRCGWWIDIGVEPLAAALSEAFSISDAARGAMGMNGRRLVESKYTWPAVAEIMATEYQKIGSDV